MEAPTLARHKRATLYAMAEALVRMIDKEQLLIYCVILAVFWAGALIVFMAQLEASAHLLQFVLTTGFFYALPAIIFGAWELDGDGWWKKALGAFLLISAFDNLVPPLAVNMHGAIATSASLSGAAIDVVIGEFWASMGISGMQLWIFTYPITFVLLVAGATYLLTERQIWNILRTW